LSKLGSKATKLVGHKYLNATPTLFSTAGATASDIFALIRYIQEQVEQRWAVWLSQKLEFWFQSLNFNQEVYDLQPALLMPPS